MSALPDQLRRNVAAMARELARDPHSDVAAWERQLFELSEMCACSEKLQLRPDSCQPSGHLSADTCPPTGHFFEASSQFLRRGYKCGRN